MWEFLLPFLTSVFSGGLGSAISAGSTEGANRRTAEGAAAQRRSLKTVLHELRNPDYNGVDAKFMLDLGRTMGQLRAQQAQRGTTGSGRGDLAFSSAITNGLADLAKFKAQDQTQRDQQIAQILSNPAFSAPNPETFDPTAAFFRGLLGGAAGGAGSAISAFLGTQGGTEILKKAFGGDGAPSAPSLPSEPFLGSTTEGATGAGLPSNTTEWGNAFSSPTFSNPYLWTGNFSDFGATP